MTLPREVTLTKDGGNFYASMVFHYVVVLIAIVPVLILLLLAIINPFWFRDSAFNWVERKVNQLTRWRNFVKYRIYLGTDPELWHTLKDRN